MMRTVALGLAGFVFLSLTATVSALVIAPAPIPDRVAMADLVIVGKITAIEEKTVLATRFPGAPEKVEHKIAMIQIDDLLKGPKGLTHARLGFVPPPPVAPPKPGQPIVSGGARRFPQLNHAVGQEACFFLSKHHEGDFLVARMSFDVVEKKAGTFEKDIAQAKRCAKLLEDPRASLQANDPQDRLATAAMLLTRYRTPRAGTPNPKTEPIDAAESTLILKAIATADWSKPVNIQEVSPQLVFGRLNLTAKDGWNPPKFKDYQKEFPAAAQQWLKANQDKHRIQRFVP
jgi:hypothetical protein